MLYDEPAVPLEDIGGSRLFGLLKNIAEKSLRDMREGFPSFGGGLVRELAEAKTMALVRHTYPMMIRSSEDEKIERLLLPESAGYMTRMRPAEWLLLQAISAVMDDICAAD